MSSLSPAYLHLEPLNKSVTVSKLNSSSFVIFSNHYHQLRQSYSEGQESPWIPAYIHWWPLKDPPILFSQNKYSASGFSWHPCLLRLPSQSACYWSLSPQLALSFSICFWKGGGILENRFDFKSHCSAENSSVSTKSKSKLLAKTLPDPDYQPHHYLLLTVQNSFQCCAFPWAIPFHRIPSPCSHPYLSKTPNSDLLNHESDHHRDTSLLRSPGRLLWSSSNPLSSCRSSRSSQPSPL